MRIRKRKVPLPLSLLSPIPLSDPHLFSRSPVMTVQGGATSTCDDKTNSIYSQPSDHFNLTYPNTSTSDLHRPIIPDNTTLTGVKEGVVPASNDDASNASLTTMKGGATPTVDNDDDDNDNAEWCDGDKAIPLKKRRGSFNNSFIEDNNTAATTTVATDTAAAASIIMKMDVKSGGNDEAKANGNSNSNGKKGNNKRGNTIMEGSRCSRVNGRGWRCCQPTLVGYSLCEHHLGKGRLRSMTSTGSNIKARTAPKKKSSSNNNASSSSPLGRDERKRADYDDDDQDKKLEKKISFGNNKRVKLGVVKARSLSSLLGQTTMEHHEKVIGQL